MQRRNALVGVFLAAVIGLLTGGCGSSGHKTPEDAFKAAKTAADKQDWKGFCDCLTENSRDNLAGGMATVGLMIKGFSALGGDAGKAKTKELDDVLTKHGLTEETLKKQGPPDPAAKGDPEAAKQAMKKMVEPVKDKTAFIADMMTAMSKMDESKKDSQSGPIAKDAELKDVKIEGDTAKGIVVSKKDGVEKKDPIEFRKVGGSWKIELSLDNMK